MIRYLLLFFLVISFQQSIFSQNTECIVNENDAKFLKGVWIGKFNQYSCGVYDTYPMTIEINNTEGNKCSGYFIWDDLPYSDSGKTILEGELIDGRLYFYENSAISGKEGLVMGGVYMTKVFNCVKLGGYWKVRQLAENCKDAKTLINGGNFEIHKVVPHFKKSKKSTNDPISKIEKDTIVERKIIIKDKIEATTKYITVKLWDNGKVDGDRVTLTINKQVILKNYEVKKRHHKLLVPIGIGENILELYAENLGRIPPNTAGISISSSGKIIKEIVLKSNLNTSEAIVIYRNE